MIQKVFHAKIYYKDIDQMGIVYYSRYFEFFEQARTELLKQIGLEVKTIESKGFFLPVIAAHCEYLESARFEDEIEVKTTILKPPEARFRIDYEITRSGADKLLVKGYTIHAFTNSEGKVKRPPPFVRNTIQQLIDKDQL